MARSDRSEDACVLCGVSVGPQGLTKAGGLQFFHCRRCGRYAMPKVMVLSMSEPADRHILSAAVRELTERGVEVRLRGPDDLEQLVSHAPQTVLERSDRLLRTLEVMTKEPGGSMEIVPELDYPLAYASSGKGLGFLLEHLQGVGYVQVPNKDAPGWHVRITPKGWLELEGRRERSLDSTKVFVAMAFDPSMRPAYDEAIKPAIQACGYRAVRIDGEHFLGPIADTILAHIRESRFVVADMTLHKGGMYLEGGYAMGRGLPVIWCCRKDEVDKVHFDTRHYNHLTWETHAELRERLTARIRATVGLAPGAAVPEEPGEGR